jgi:hypothetical protein
MAVKVSRLGLPMMLLLLHLASVWATLYAAWMLAGRCWHAREARAGAVVLLACWLSLPVAGTALMLMDPYLTARSFSTPCMVLALVGALDVTDLNRQRARGFAMWSAGIFLAGAMHPLMAAYAVGGTLLLACLRSARREVQVWGTVALCASAIGLATCLQAITSPESAEYVRIAMTRTYWFPVEWRWFELVGLAAPLIILGIQGWNKPRVQTQDVEHPDSGLRAVARAAVTAGATACLVAVLFARVGASTHLLGRLQPLRAFQMVYLVMVLVLGAKLGEWVLGDSAWRWIGATVVLGGAMFGAARADFPHSRHLELPGMQARNPWVRAFVWIRENTPKDALYALDADYINAPEEDAQCFRAIAERSALPDYSKDGGEASIAPELTAEWQKGQAAQRGLSDATDAERAAALGPLGVDWLVMQARAKTSLDCPYENGTVRVCRLR